MSNVLVTGVLESPAHRFLSRRLDLVRYSGRRSGARYTIPTMYARVEDGLVMLVGWPERKTWWRNFVGGHDLEVLVRGRWLPMTGRALRGADDPAAVRPLLDAYLERFPRARRALGPDPADPVDGAVVVHCRPR